MTSSQLKNKKGFTLIELLIVVAIIAILAAIALPNFQAAQTRAKVARVKTDFRTLNVALQSYRVDHNDYPSDKIGAGWANDFYAFIPLTTPIAYITAVPIDSPFDKGIMGARGNYSYWRTNNPEDGIEDRGLGIFYAITSVGPDLKWDMSFNALNAQMVVERGPDFLNDLYDPTNGTISHGDLHCSNFGISF